MVIIDYGKSYPEIWKQLMVRITALRDIHKKKNITNVPGIVKITPQCLKFAPANSEVIYKEISASQMVAFDSKIAQVRGAVFGNKNFKNTSDDSGFNTPFTKEGKEFIYVTLNEDNQTLRMDTDNQFYISALTDHGKIMTPLKSVNYADKSLENSSSGYKMYLECRNFFQNDKTINAIIQIIAESCRSVLVEKAFEKLFLDESNEFPDDVQEGLKLVYKNYDACFQRARGNGILEATIQSNKNWMPLTVAEYTVWMEGFPNGIIEKIDTIKTILDTASPTSTQKNLLRQYQGEIFDNLKSSYNLAPEFKNANSANLKTYIGLLKQRRCTLNDDEKTNVKALITYVTPS